VSTIYISWILHIHATKGEVMPCTFIFMITCLMVRAVLTTVSILSCVQVFKPLLGCFAVKRIEDSAGMKDLNYH
jgi:hypothetical protein